MQADVFLEYIDREGYIILLCNPKRHSKNVNLLYGSKYKVIEAYWPRLPFEGDVRLDRLLFRVLKYLLRLVKRQNLFGWLDLLEYSQKVKTENYLEYPGSSYAIHKLWYISKRPHDSWEGLKLPEESALKIKKYFGELVESSKLAAVYIRNKPDQNRVSHLRSGKSLIESLHIIDSLIQRGFKVLIYGDVKSQHLVKVADRDILSYLNTAIPKELWDLLVPTISEFVVGPSGGGLQIPIKMSKPILALDVFGFWNGFPNCLHSYKIVKNKDGEIINPTFYFSHMPFEHKFQQLEIEFTPKELDLQILDEFYEALKYWPVKQKIIRFFHPGSALTFSPNARISHNYLSYVGVNEN